LHAVLVHSGDNHGGHYVVYIHPRGDGKWCKFDDDVVSRCSKLEAIDRNFGGFEDDVLVKHCTNAYMLVYIRENVLNKVLGTIAENDIPESLNQRLQEEKHLEALRRKERAEAHLYMIVQVVTEDHFASHQGNDLFDVDKCPYRMFKIKKTATLHELIETLASTMKYSINQIRPWGFSLRSNHTLRPHPLDYENDCNNKSIHEISETENPWTIFVETINPETGPQSLPVFDRVHDVLLFFKKYDPKTKSIMYCGHIYMPITDKLANIMPILCQRAGFSSGTELVLYEEVKPNHIERIGDYNLPVEEVFEELMDGDIIVFQKAESDLSQYSLPTVKDYFRDLFFRIEVTFCDKTINNDTGFTLELSQRMNYELMAEAVAQHLGTEPYLLQFFKCQGYRDGPGNSIRCSYEGNLKDLLVYTKPGPQKKIYYQHLSIRINELENKKQFKCVWVSDKLKEEKELVLYPSKNGTVAHLLEEARKHVELSDSNAKLRLLEIVSYKIVAIQNDHILLDCLNVCTKVYRVEEIPPDELNVADDEILIPVAHFHRETFSTFGIPFILKIKNGETLTKVKERIQKKIDVPDKEFEKYKFAIVLMGRQTYLPEDKEYIIDINDFHVHHGQAIQSHARPWLGLDHVNKTPKRARHNYLEKAIKIHN